MNAAHAVWSRPALREQVLRRRRDDRADVALRVAALDERRRALTLQQYVESLPGVVRVRLDVHARRMRVTFHPDATSVTRLLDACDACGCPAQPLRRECLDAPNRLETEDSLKRLAVAGLFTMQAMMFALVLYLGVINPVDTLTMQMFRWLGLLAATPVVGYAAVPFFRHALADLRAGRAGIDVPIALAVAMVYAASFFSTVRGHGEIWFDSASMLVFVLLLGRHLELRARCRHQALNDAAADAMPLLALRRLAGGNLETVAAIELTHGDVVQVPEGSVIPADGVLAGTRARLDTSHHDGESRVRFLRRGDPVRAGSLVLDAPAELEVTHAGTETGAMQMQHVADAAARQRSRTDGGDAPGVRRFVAGVLGLAAATGAFWLWHDPARAFDTVVALLVVACPCAFALAAPATLTRAMAVLARQRIVLTRPRALLALARADRALFDKTGTLTQPSLDTDRIQTFGALTPLQALDLAAALARGSSHPLAQAVLRAHAGHRVATATDVRVTAGGGIRGRIDGRVLALGRAGFAGPGQADDDALWLADDDVALARFGVHETLRAGTRDTIDALRSAPMHIGIASGDSRSRVQAIAARLGIDDWQARQRPGDKFDRIRRWQHAGHCVLVVGDGSNDAAALAAADVSASLAGATDLARRHADVLLDEDPRGLVLARHVATQTTRIMRQNRRWGLAWNAAAMPLAAMGLVSPWLAALGMSLSSLAVVLNALRLDAPAQDHRPSGRTRLEERLA